jgi:Fe-S-cluster containining protein
MTSLPIVGQPAHEPGPVEKALAELWKVAQPRVYSLSHWRETIRLLRRFNVRFLRLGELKVVVPYGQVPDCDNCTEICCTGPNAIVSLRLRDVAALVDKGLEQHITASTVRPAARDVTWARKEADGSVFHQAFPVLTRDKTGTCTLLNEDRHCGAYPSWPLSCARYPYALDLESKVIFWAKGCRSTQVLPTSEAPPRVRELVRAVVDAYNERLKDVILLHVARKELEEIGLLKYVDTSKL